MTRQQLEDRVAELEREVAVFRDLYFKVLTLGPNDFAVFSTPLRMTREQKDQIRKRLQDMLSLADNRRVIVLTADCELFAMPDLLRERDDQIDAMRQEIRRLKNDPL